MGLEQQLAELLAKQPDIKLIILFGSVAGGSEGPESDLDIAVAGDRSLGTAQKMVLIDELAQVSGRPVDLIDLQSVGGTLLHRLLTKGKVVVCKDSELYGELIKKMLFHEADMMPYYRRILAERRQQWLAE